MSLFLFISVLTAAGVSTCAASQWRASEQLLNAVRLVESSNGRHVYGDRGQALGEYQLTKAAWTDVNQWRRSNRKRTYSYSTHVFDRKVSRSYAADYLAILQLRLQKRLKRSPSVGELYAAYNMGFQSFAECRFQLRRVNPATLRKCRQVEQLVRTG